MEPQEAEAEMSQTRFAAVAQKYGSDGFFFPLQIMSSEEAAACRGRLEDAERRHGASLPIARYLRSNTHLLMTLADELAHHPAVLDAVEAVLGPDLLIWNCDFFIKEAHSEGFVSWHQDLTYWGLDSTEEVTAWLALSPATPESGCMRFVPGSHRREIVSHRDTFADDNMLSRGQEIAVEVAESDAVDVALQPGQMSLHHGRMFHASGPNRSADRRIGAAIRYISPRMRQVVGERDFAVLARGADRHGHFTLLPRPTEDFAPEARARYEEVDAIQRRYFYEGAAQDGRGPW